MSKFLKNLKITRHYPPSNQEWFNSIYVYDKNSIKSLPIKDNILNNLVKNFFSLTFNNIRNKTRIFLKCKSTNRIFISRTLIKHTNNKIVITLFTYNREKFYLLKKMKIFYNKNTRVKKNKRLLGFLLHQKIQKLYDKLNIIKYNYILNKKINNEKKLLLLILKKNSKYLDFWMLKQYLKISTYRFLIAKQFINYNKLLLLNNYKFKNFFLIYLKELIKKFYNKHVEFKIINLKKLHLNNDIFLQSIALKVKKRQYVLKVFNKVLKLVKLSSLNQDLKKPCCKDIELIKKRKKDKNTYYFNKIFIYDNLFDNIAINAFNSVKHKFIIGVRLEAQGRLTKRLTASRSIFKFRSKGNIKNIDSSDKGISTVILKGNTKSNIQYTLINSKTPNGSFGLRGWINSY